MMGVGTLVFASSIICGGSSHPISYPGPPACLLIDDQLIIFSFGLFLKIVSVCPSDNAYRDCWMVTGLLTHCQNLSMYICLIRCYTIRFASDFFIDL